MGKSEAQRIYVTFPQVIQLINCRSRIQSHVLIPQPLLLTSMLYWPSKHLSVIIIYRKEDKWGLERFRKWTDLEHGKWRDTRQAKSKEFWQDSEWAWSTRGEVMRPIWPDVGGDKEKSDEIRTMGKLVKIRNTFSDNWISRRVSYYNWVKTLSPDVLCYIPTQTQLLSSVVISNRFTIGKIERGNTNCEVRINAGLF